MPIQKLYTDDHSTFICNGKYLETTKRLSVGAWFKKKKNKKNPYTSIALKLLRRYRQCTIDTQNNLDRFQKH